MDFVHALPLVTNFFLPLTCNEYNGHKKAIDDMTILDYYNKQSLYLNFWLECNEGQKPFLL